MTWIKTEDQLPAPGRFVLAYIKNEFGKGRIIRAEYIPYGWCEGDESDTAFDYDEETDTYWVKEGWYEQNEYEITHWRVSDEVTHWMHLPDPPEEE